MDDEEVVKDIAGRMLEHLGYKDIVFTRDGNEAIKLFGEAIETGNPFSVVILDLTIPGGMGGAETIKKLRKIDPGIKAIVSSGYSDNRIMARYKDSGFQAVVAKPYTLEQLGKALNELFSEKSTVK
jgi:CheY-like chemotaxis protein